MNKAALVPPDPARMTRHVQQLRDWARAIFTQARAVGRPVDLSASRIADLAAHNPDEYAAIEHYNAALEARDTAYGNVHEFAAEHGRSHGLLPDGQDFVGNLIVSWAQTSVPLAFVVSDGWVIPTNSGRAFAISVPGGDMREAEAELRRFLDGFRQWPVTTLLVEALADYAVRDAEATVAMDALEWEHGIGSGKCVHCP